VGWGFFLSQCTGALFSISNKKIQFSINKTTNTTKKNKNIWGRAPIAPPLLNKNKKKQEYSKEISKTKK